MATDCTRFKRNEYSLDVIGNRDRWDWMHRDVSSPRTPDDSYVTPAQKRVSFARKRASRIPVSVRKTN